ncbi:MAG: cupin domain-containing protein, partial [Vitreoscilla sp.]|nr:cupin domain-containing protein [Polaromonas sp.]
QEAGFVLLGQIEVTVGEQTQVLTAGDGYYFESQIPHRFRYVGNSKA